MKIAMLFLILLISVGLILFSVAACGWNGGGGSPVDGTPRPVNLKADNLTATYGAGLLHIQMTALASSQVAGDSQAQP